LAVYNEIAARIYDPIYREYLWSTRETPLDFFRVDLGERVHEATTCATRTFEKGPKIDAEWVESDI
jgi:hypothetical protein